MQSTRSRTEHVTAFTLVLWLLLIISSGCTRTTSVPLAGTNVNQQSSSPFAAQPAPDIRHAATPLSEAAIVPVAPAGAVIDTAQLPDTLYGNTTDMSAPQFYDATTPAVVTPSGSRAASVIVEEASLHLRPDAKSKTVERVASGTTVRLNAERSGAWFYVASESGASGWIHGNNIKLVAADALPMSGGKGDSGKSNGEKSDEVKASRSKTMKAAASIAADADASDGNDAEKKSNSQSAPATNPAAGDKPHPRP